MITSVVLAIATLGLPPKGQLLHPGLTPYTSRGEWHYSQLQGIDVDPSTGKIKILNPKNYSYIRAKAIYKLIADVGVKPASRSETAEAAKPFEAEYHDVETITRTWSGNIPMDAPLIWNVVILSRPDSRDMVTENGSSSTTKLQTTVLPGYRQLVSKGSLVVEEVEHHEINGKSEHRTETRRTQTYDSHTVAYGTPYDVKTGLVLYRKAAK